MSDVPKNPHFTIQRYERCPQEPSASVPLHGLLPNTAGYTPTSTSMSKVPHVINIEVNSKISDAASISRPFSCQLSAATSPIIVIGNFAQLNGFDLIRLFVLDLIWLTGSWLASTHRLLNWFESLVTELIRLTGYWLDLTQHFWLDLTLHLRIDLTLRFRLDSTHCFQLD